MDLRMPGMDGLTAIEQIRYNWPHIAILILTTYEELIVSSAIRPSKEDRTTALACYK